ncbi:MAG: helix-turn-helix domain-containing protein [Sulfuricella sp.]
MLRGLELGQVIRSLMKSTESGQIELGIPCLPATRTIAAIRAQFQFILDMLEKHDWQIKICASALGISRKNLWQKMRRLNISRG